MDAELSRGLTLQKIPDTKIDDDIEHVRRGPHPSLTALGGFVGGVLLSVALALSIGLGASWPGRVGALFLLVNNYCMHSRPCCILRLQDGMA